MTKLFYFPSDWLSTHTNQRMRLALACWISLFWLGPGFVLWLFLLHALWFVGLMSIVALWLTGFTMIGSETPVEPENNNNDKGGQIDN